MGTITSTYFMSLDGVVESPETFTMDYADDDLGASIKALAGSYDAFVMGRRQYDEWSQHWPKIGDEDPFAAAINRVPKYVVSDSLTDAAWNNTTIVRRADAAAQLRALREQTDRVVGTWGSLTVVKWMLANDLVDRLHLIVCPIVVGKGEHLFQDTARHPLRLESERSYPSGVVELTLAAGG